MTFKPDPQLEGLIIVISKKVAKLATQRNKLRRRIKETIRTSTTPKPCFGVVGYLYTRKGVIDLDFIELKKELLEIIQKID